MTEKNFHPEDNIEIPSFKSFLINGFRFFFKFLDLVFLTLRKNTTILLIGAVAGALIGILRHLTNEKNFAVSMVVEYTVLDHRAYTEVLDEFETLVRTQSYETLASDLKVSPMISQNINRIEGQTIDERSLSKDTSNYPFFKIALGLKSSFGVDSLETALVNYFNELPYLKKIKEDQAKVYADQLVSLDSDEVRMDSLKTAYTHSIGAVKPGTGVYISEADPANIYKQSFQLDTIRITLKNWMNAKSKPMLLVRGFRATKTPQSLSAPASIVLSIFLGLLAAFIFALFKEINKKINAA